MYARGQAEYSPLLATICHKSSLFGISHHYMPLFVILFLVFYIFCHSGFNCIMPLLRSSITFNNKLSLLFYLFVTATGKAFLVPKFTKYAHRLFPCHAHSLFTNPKVGASKLEELNNALDSEPWVFGFQTVLKNRFNISGCEAKLSAFIECDLLRSMPVEKQGALYIYNALCAVIRKFGHTYILLRELKQLQCYSKPYCPETYQLWQTGRGVLLI